MKILEGLADSAILGELGRRIAHRRVEADLTQEALAREAGISKRTVERLEAGASVQLTSLVRVLRTLNLLGNLETLLPEALPGPMELLERGKRRERARPRTSKRANKQRWEWGDDT